MAGIATLCHDREILNSLCRGGRLRPPRDPERSEGGACHSVTCHRPCVSAGRLRCAQPRTKASGANTTPRDLVVVLTSWR